MSATLPAPSGVSVVPAPPRLVSVDIIRGMVMVLMAIDHVRVYSGLPAGGPTPGIFFTRWVTHFCAPAFIFLAGTSAFLRSPGATRFLLGREHEGLSRYLFQRGAWLVLLELTVIRVSWTFNFDFGGYLLAGVIWIIGWCMILMALLVKLPVRVVGWSGVAIIALHNAIMPRLMGALPDGLSWLRSVLYNGFFEPPIHVGGEGGPTLMVLYVLVPWIGVMMAGYGFGAILKLEPGRRNRLCLQIGLGAIALFLVLRGFNLYGDPRPWSAPSGSADGPQMPALLSFLNTTKYPASLSFLLMTLGPTIALIPWLERAGGAVAYWLSIFGHVPLFFYVLHIPLIHALALLVSLARTGAVNPWLFANHPMGSGPAPDGYAWSLGLLYLVWAVAVVLLLFASLWFSNVKSLRRGAWWLSYL